MKEGKPTLFIPGVGKEGMNELHYAAYCGNLGRLIHAFTLGLDVNAVDTYRGYTALHWVIDMAATAGARSEIFDELVTRGANINARSADGQTPLSLAREAGSKLGDELAAKLVTLGATL